MRGSPSTGAGSDRQLRYDDVRPYVAPDRLDQLRGPVSGVLELPRALDWTPLRRYRLENPDEVEVLYEVVIREASTVGELERYLNEDLVRARWPRLVLPGRCRTLWEQRFPELAQPVAR